MNSFINLIPLKPIQKFSVTNAINSESVNKMNCWIECMKQEFMK